MDANFEKDYKDLGFAKLDTLRGARQGAGEVVYCEGKSDEQLRAIFRALFKAEGRVLGTRASEAQYLLLKEQFPEITFDPLSRILTLEPNTDDAPFRELKGLVAVCTAGTADIPAAEEAARTAEFMGSRVERYFDIGVSGLNRLLSNIDAIRQANCIVAAAGMEGALASVLGGLTDKPVIAVPTSVGYGANFEGLSALLTMINSCANSVSVVNIDNGFGAGFIASRINLLIANAGGTHSAETDIGPSSNDAKGSDR